MYKNEQNFFVIKYGKIQECTTKNSHII